MLIGTPIRLAVPREVVGRGEPANRRSFLRAVFGQGIFHDDTPGVRDCRRRHGAVGLERDGSSSEEYRATAVVRGHADSIDQSGDGRSGNLGDGNETAYRIFDLLHGDILCDHNAFFIRIDRRDDVFCDLSLRVESSGRRVQVAFVVECKHVRFLIPPCFFGIGHEPMRCVGS